MCQLRETFDYFPRMMLCKACQDIFSIPRKLSYGTYYPWAQDPESFQAALQAGCHLCSLVEESISHESTDEEFPQDIRFAFKALNPEWARSGFGPKWFAPQVAGDEWNEQDEEEQYLRRVEMDPTPNGLASLLATDDERLVTEARDSWLVLEFYGKGVRLVLPMEFADGDETEELAQTNLGSQTSTGCKENLQLCKVWLSNCLATHTSCGPRQPEKWLPTRLLDVGDSDNSTLRLVSGSSVDPESQYLALSHRWGNDMGGVLSSNNVAAYRQTIQLSDISATIRDSVVVTRSLGFRYLWADSMCIIQDDENDWARESVTMSKVYGLSTCTIAAVNSGCGSNGYFRNRNQYRVRPCRVPNPFTANSKYSFNIRSQYLNRIHEKQVRGSLWYNRGWVFQERTLSPRLLIFSDTQILWACEQLQAAESWPCGKTSDNHIDQFESFTVEKARFDKLLDRSNGVSISQSAWWTFLKDYMASAELTKRSDRLVAIQGIATIIEELTGTKYVAGYWLNDQLSASLLWKVGSVKRFRSSQYHVPSWSWAALDGPVKLDTTNFQSPEYVARILGHEVHPDKSSSRIHDVLRVEGILYHAAIVLSRDGDRCERVVTVQYSKTIIARLHTVFRKVWGRFLLPVSLFLWKYGLRHISIVIGAVLLIALVPVGIALMPAAICLGGTLVSCYYLCYYLGLSLLPVAKCFWVYIRGTLCFCIDRKAEKEVQRRNVEAERRREDAIARSEKYFADLERGICPAELVDVSANISSDDDEGAKEGSVVRVTCSLDLHLPGGSMVDMTFCPVVRSVDVTSGLVLVLVKGTTDQYVRLGVFEALDRELQKLHHSSQGGSFLLL